MFASMYSNSTTYVHLLITERGGRGLMHSCARPLLPPIDVRRVPRPPAPEEGEARKHSLAPPTTPAARRRGGARGFIAINFYNKVSNKVSTISFLISFLIRFLQ